MRPLPIERALKTDILTVLAVYQQQYFNTNDDQEGPTHQNQSCNLYFWKNDTKIVIDHRIS